MDDLGSPLALAGLPDRSAADAALDGTLAIPLADRLADPPAAPAQPKRAWARLLSPGLRSAMALAVGFAALGWIVVSVGLHAVWRDLAAAGWALPFTVAVFLVQLYLAGQAWRASLGDAAGRLQMFRLRWVREGINTLLPVAQVGGPVAGARMLARSGMRAPLAAAGTILDLTLEAGSQLVFTLVGIAVLVALRGDRGWVGWLGGGLAVTACGVAGFVALQRLGALRLLERLLAATAARWPTAAGWSLAGLHAELMLRQANGRALARAAALHLVSWALGGAEVWIVLAVLGHPVPALAATVIESLGMAARSAGFAVPGAVGVQEGGFVLVCAAFGVPAEAALALSVTKRLREALVGVPALVAWQRSS